MIVAVGNYDIDLPIAAEIRHHHGAGLRSIFAYGETLHRIKRNGRSLIEENTMAHLLITAEDIQVAITVEIRQPDGKAQIRRGQGVGRLRAERLRLASVEKISCTRDGVSGHQVGPPVTVKIAHRHTHGVDGFCAQHKAAYPAKRRARAVMQVNADAVVVSADHIQESVNIDIRERNGVGEIGA